MPSKEKHNESHLSSSQQERRAFMEKAGKLAAYTPPLMLGLLIPGEHAIASGGYDPSVGKQKIKQKENKVKKK